MDSLRQFKKQIYISAAGLILICEIASIFISGFDFKFAYGLLLGTAISILNFNILSFALENALYKNRKKAEIISAIGYAARMSIYAAALFYTLRVGYSSFFGTIFAFISMKAAIYLVPLCLSKKS